jgi:hypothetical protein
MSVTYVDLFDNGVWIKAPATTVDGNTMVVTGKWFKTATIQAEECLEYELKDPLPYLQSLKDQQRSLKADLFTFAQKIPNTSPRYDYAIEWDSIAAVRLATFADWWAGLRQETRKNVRLSAKRGVVIRLETLSDDIVGGIVEINNETPIRQGRRFTHFHEHFDKVQRDFLSFTDRSDLLCAYFGSELIGLAKIIYCGQVAAIMKLQTKVSHYDKKVANALIANAMERCAQRGFQYVTYGQYRYGNQEQTSLMTFKDRHGFGEILVPRYYVPVTWSGALCVSLKLYRGAVGLLPSGIIELGRSFRARWNKH